MPAALAERVTADEHARPRNQASIDRLFHAPVGAACIANGGEPLVEGFLDRLPDLVGHQACWIGPALGTQVDVECAHVDMSVDQSRHQGLTAAVDNLA